MIENKVQIPKGWNSATLSEITSKLVDGSHSPPPKQSGGFPMLSAINIDNNKINFSSYRLITKSSFELEDCRTRIKAGDVLLTIVGAIGRTAVVPDGIKPFTLQRSVAVLTPILVDPKFLMYQIESPDLSNFFMRNARGTAQKGIYLNVLGGTEILIPPLNEQKRIVAKIEELFSELDKGVESLKTAREQLKVYRQAVLKHAFEGKLTTHWREQNKNKLETADQLLERIKREREAYYQIQLEEWKESIVTWETNGKEGKQPSQPKSPDKIVHIREEDLKQLPKLPQGWMWIKLLNISKNIQIGPFGSLLHQHDYVAGGWPLVNPSHIKDQKIYPDNNLTITAEKLKELTNYRLQEGDVVMGRRGEMGRCAVVTKKEAGWLCGTGSLFVRLLDSFCSWFYCQALSSQRAKEYLSSSSIGTTMQNLNQKILYEMPVPVCSVEEQIEIMKEIERQFSVIDGLEETINSELQKSAALRQSILKKAFTGRLVAQEPNDEPASVLLERIRAEKEAQITESKKPKAKRNAA